MNGIVATLQPSHGACVGMVRPLLIRSGLFSSMFSDPLVSVDHMAAQVRALALSYVFVTPTENQRNF